jgi:lysophospholipase L1-like esterase
MYVQGKQIRNSVPKLPEAKEPQGAAKAATGSELTFRLATLGESTIAGVGVEFHEDGFSGTLARKLADATGMDVAWHVYARSGYTSKRLQQKLIPRMDQDAFDLIVVGLGGNDAFTLNSPWAWKKNVKMIISDLEQKYPGTPVVFCNMPPIKEFPAFTPLIRAVVGNLVELLGKSLNAVVANYDHVFYLKSDLNFLKTVFH